MPDIYGMNYKQLGSSSLRLSEIGFGCMSLKGSEDENRNLVDKAIAAGINFFDTADLYDKGENEKTLGKAVKDKRKHVILASKVGNQWRQDGSGWDWNPRKEYILAAVDESLQRLQTDYIDLYQLHGGTINDPLDETIEAFEILKQQGKILFYGISSIRPNVIREYIKRSTITSVMMQYSLLDRRPEEECLHLLHNNAIGVLARGSLAQGLLVNKPAKEYLGRTIDEVSRAANLIRNLSGENRSAGQTAIQFVLQHPAVTSAVVGIRNEQQLNEAIGAAKAPMLTESEIEQLKSVVSANFYAEHR